MNGPEATARLLENNANQQRPGSPRRAELNSIAADVRGGRATYEQLNRAQEVMYSSGRRSIFVSPQNPAGLREAEVATLARNGGAAVSSRSLTSADSLRNVTTRLQPGQSATICVASQPGVDKPDHFITVGRQPNGTPYIYNPSPARGDATVVTGRSPTTRNPTGIDAGLNRELGRYESEGGGRLVNNPDGTGPRIITSTPPPAPPPPAVPTT
jgi:hypothetical protein